MALVGFRTVMNETSIHAVVAPIVPNETNTAICSHRGTERCDTGAANEAGDSQLNRSNFWDAPHSAKGHLSIFSKV
jgi:hypothetical protein